MALRANGGERGRIFAVDWRWTAVLSVFVILMVARLADTESDVFTEPVDRTMVRLGVLERELKAAMQKDTTEITQMSHLLKNLPSGMRRTLVNDGWERPFRLTREAQLYELRSSGPDARFDTADDMVREVSASTKIEPSHRRPNA